MTRLRLSFLFLASGFLSTGMFFSGVGQEAPLIRGRAYPDIIPKDVSFETVVSSQPYPAVKFPVPIIGWKEHPEEFHVTPNGAIVSPAPNPESPGANPSKAPGFYIVPMVSF